MEVQAAVKSRVNSPEGPLRVIIMSATVDADRFSHYWGCPVLYVPGRQFPVNVRHIRLVRSQVFSLYDDKILRSSETEDWQKSMLSTILYP